MKKFCSLLLALLFIICLCGAAAPGSPIEVTGTDMVLTFPKDYVVFGQKGPMTDNASAGGFDQERIDSTTAFMQENGTLMCVEQIDGYDTIYVDSGSFKESRSIQDFTKFCQTSGKSDDELIATLEETAYFDGPNSEFEGYVNESAEIVTINGEKYGYSVGWFESDDLKLPLLEYVTVKNGKIIRVEMYSMGEAVNEDQIKVLRGIMESVGYTRGAAGFLSQAYQGMNGAALLSWIILAVVVVVGIVVLIVCLRIRRKKHPKPKKDAQQGVPVMPNGAYTPPGMQNPGQPYMQQPQQNLGGTQYQSVPPQGTNPPQGGYAPVAPPQQQQWQPPVQPIPQQPVEQTPYAPPQQAQQFTSPQQEAPTGQQAVYGQPAPPSAPQGQTDIVVLLENLAELKRQGVISPEEYEYKKSELLRRL